MADKELLEEDFIGNITSNTGINSIGNIYIYTPDSLGSLSNTARAILDELKDWHRRVEKHGSREIHPAYLLSIDKIPEVLNKFNSLPTQAKTEAAIHQALKQIIDFDRKGQNRVAYIYPYLVRDGSKIKAKICLFAPQKDTKTDAAPFRKSCFQASKELIDQILNQRAKKIRVVDEENPGNYLFNKNKSGETWLYPRIGSLEFEINNLIKKSFLPIHPIPIPEFTQDFIHYAKQQKAVIELLPDYHIILDELQLDENGGFKSQPEVINQYRAQVDALEKFALTHLKKLAEEGNYIHFLEELNKFNEEYVIHCPPGRKQSSDKAKKLIQLVESFPFDKFTSQYSKKVQETLYLSTKIIQKLLIEKDLILERKNESLYTKILKDILDVIPEYTKNNLTLQKINFEEEIKKLGITDLEKIKKYSERLKEDICSKFSYYELKNEDGSSTFYVVDHGYMAAVLHKLTADADKSPELKKQLDIAKSINEKLTNPKHPELNAKLKPENIVKLSSDIREIEKQRQERLKSLEFKQKLNLPAGVLTFITSTLIFLTASYIIKSIVPIIFGIPFSIVISVMAAIFFREKSREEMRKEILESGKFKSKLDSGSFESSYNTKINSKTTGNSDDELEKKSEKISEIYKAADGYIFPTRFNKITDKVLDLKTIQKRIYASLDDIRRKNISLAKEKDNDKVASTVEYAITQSCAVINIPPELTIQYLPSTLYILKNDLKSPLFREQLADHYRDEMNKKKYDKKLVKYYTFLINTIEMDYYKYLPKKRI